MKSVAPSIALQYARALSAFPRRQAFLSVHGSIPSSRFFLPKSSFSSLSPSSLAPSPTMTMGLHSGHQGMLHTFSLAPCTLRVFSSSRRSPASASITTSTPPPSPGVAIAPHLPSSQAASSLISKPSSPAGTSSSSSPTSSPAPLSFLNFDDHKTAFQYHTTGELLRALLILKLCSFSIISSNSEKIVHLLKRTLGKHATALAFTLLHRHFAGGETYDDLQPTLQRLQTAGIGAILDYAAEADVDPAAGSATPTATTSTSPLTTSSHADLVPNPMLPSRLMSPLAAYPAERECDANVSIFLESVRAASACAQGFAAIKVTALIDPPVLLDLATACAKNSASTPAADPFAGLPSGHAAQADRCLARLHTIAEHAAAGRVRLMVDAEQTYFQPAIDWMVQLMQRKFNRSWPNVFNTYQCYLVDAQARLQADLALCAKENLFFGAKLVRGAYMMQERQRAHELGLPDPIQPDIEATHRNYNACIELVLPHVVTRGANVMIASHNEDSISRTAEAMERLQIPKDAGVFFGQLLGMADHVTYTLGHKSYAVYKYVPYGPVYEVVAYLSRRVQENSSVTGGQPIRKARAMLARELRRRLHM